MTQKHQRGEFSLLPFAMIAVVGALAIIVLQARVMVACDRRSGTVVLNAWRWPICTDARTK